MPPVDTTDILAGVDDIPWHALGAGEVPRLLQNLADGAEDTAWLLEQLDERLWNQGTVYPATPHAVPFITRLAVAGIESYWFARLVGHIARTEEHSRFYAADLGRAARDAAWDQAAVLAPLLADPEAEVRASTLWTLAACHPVDQVLPFVRERWTREPDRTVQAVVLLALGELDADLATGIGQEVLTNSADARLRLIAAAVHVDAGRPWQDRYGQAAIHWSADGEELPEDFWDYRYHPLRHLVLALAVRREYDLADEVVSTCLAHATTDDVREYIADLAVELAEVD